MNPAPLPASCARVQGRLEALADHGLPALEEARDRGHLEACEGCRRGHEAHVALLAAVRASVSADLEADCARVAAAVLPELGAARRRRRTLPLSLVAAAAAALALFLIRTRGPGFPAPGAQEMAALEGVLERLPSWEDVVRGLERLSRGWS